MGIYATDSDGSRLTSNYSDTSFGYANQLYADSTGNETFTASWDANGDSVQFFVDSVQMNMYICEDTAESYLACSPSRFDVVLSSSLGDSRCEPATVQVSW